jgi:hypothetical protein
LCGRAAAQDDAPATAAGTVPLGWSLEKCGDRILAICPECTRNAVRSIEARLDQQWW